MASFEVDYKAAASSPTGPATTNPAAISLVHQAQKEFDSAKRPIFTRRSRRSSPATRPMCRSTIRPYIYATGAKVHGFAVNPGGAYRLENVWLS